MGQYLVIAALNRAVDPASNRALYDDWYKDIVVSRLWKAKETGLSRQRFWNHLDQVEPEDIERIQKDVPARLAEGPGGRGAGGPGDRGAEGPRGRATDAGLRRG